MDGLINWADPLARAARLNGPAAEWRGKNLDPAGFSLRVLES